MIVAHPPLLTPPYPHVLLPACRQALKAAGCDEVVLAINYRPQVGGSAPCVCPVGAKTMRPCTQSLADPHRTALPTAVPLHCRPVLLLQVMMDFLKEWEEKLNIKITCSQVEGLLWVAWVAVLWHWTAWWP
jgi:hypothetical protein